MNQKVQAIQRRALLQSLPLSVAGAWAWGQSKTQGGFRAGAAQVDVTTPLGVTNGGIIMRGSPAGKIHDPMYVRCVAFDNGSQRLALVVCDLRMIDRATIDHGKKLAAEALGWPAESMLVSATHSHAVPGLVGKYATELDEWYANFVGMRIADAIQGAVRNLEPAKVGWAAIAKPDHVFNRRWFVEPGNIPQNPFGEHDDKVLMNPSRTAKLIEPAGPVDPQLSILSVKNLSGRSLAVLANYGMHYVGGYQDNQISADYFGIFSRRVSELLDSDSAGVKCVAMMTNGASGDVNNSNFLKPRGPMPPWTHMRTVANDLADAAVDSIKTLEHHPNPMLGSAQSILALKVRHPSGQRIDWARKIVADIKNATKLSRPEIYAQEALFLSEFPETRDVVLQAYRIGDFGITSVPCEVFAETGLAIRKQNPLPITCTIELANGYAGYLPTPRQHALGGYETWPARSSFLEVEASEKIQAELAKLTSQLG